MKKYIILVLALISIFYVYNNVDAEENIIPDEAIRFRVIANSNTVYDQNIKIQVRNVIQNKILELLNGVDDINQTRDIIKNNIDLLNNLTEETLNNLNYDMNFNINYGYNYFPEKKYKGIKYKAGNYESLVITLGEGEGDNWWCVLFPPLCLVEADESDVDESEYTFFVKEIIEKYSKVNKYLTK
jgi:stage II sporulation protein R